MTLTFGDAADEDVEELKTLYASVALHLTSRFGQGRWSHDLFGHRLGTVPGRSVVRVGRNAGRILTSLRLQTKKPWAIDVAYFTPANQPLYLTGMVVDVSSQRTGLGRAALEDAHHIARAWVADAIRLDAYDAPAGAGAFYAKCGYRACGQVAYRGNPLVYYEFVLA